MTGLKIRLASVVAVLVFAPTLARSSAQDPAEKAKADGITALAKARVKLARKAYDAALASLKESKRIDNRVILSGHPQDVHLWSVRWLEAQRDLSSKHADRVSALESHLKRMSDLEKQVKAMIVDLLPPHAAWDAEWYRLEAQFWLAKAKESR